MSLRRLFSRLFPVRFICSHGWKTKFIDDGYGKAGWYAFLGSEHDPELETAICATKAEAARDALHYWPHKFA